MKFCFYTLGCKVNRSETQALQQLATARGHEIVDCGADVCIINTCTVTSTSDHKNIRAFHKARKENPNALIAATGCFSQVDPEKVGAQPEIDLVCGTGDRAAVIEKCEQAVMQNQEMMPLQPDSPPRVFEPLPAGIPEGRTRALLKIQDGCDQYCTYCIIPYARGHVRSMPQAEVLRQVELLGAQGVHEIVLTGIEISSYGIDLSPATDLVELLEAVLAAVPNVRIRLSSLEPRTVDEAFCTRLAGYDNLMKHFHLSLQSGCDSVLVRMKRRYKTEDYAAAVSRVRTAFPDCSVTTDLIVGFPGETEEEFCKTLAFIRRCDFAQMHIFPYSVRRGTVAATLPGQLAPEVKTLRAKRAKQIAKEMAKSFEDRFIGRELNVLLEHEVAPGIWSGHAAYHFPVRVELANGKKNRFAFVRIEKRTAEGLSGKEI